MREENYSKILKAGAHPSSRIQTRQESIYVGSGKSSEVKMDMVKTGSSTRDYRKTLNTWELM